MSKIAIIGAGSASFGLNTLAALMDSRSLRGSHLALVDRNQRTLGLISSLAEKLNTVWDSQMRISSHTHHKQALEGADFVIISIEVSPREQLWRSDYEIPLKYGVRQPYAENGGPGGFAHAARNIGPVMEIAHDMERLCPNAWMINYTNPMMRICDAVNRYSKIKVVGLCHQINAGYAMVGKTLANELGLDIPDGFIDCHASPVTNPLRAQVSKQALPRIQITAAGLNHFTFMLDLHDKNTGADLYPLFRERWADLPEDFEPLTRRIFAAFGLFPIPGDEHLAEYLPWVSDRLTKPWEKYQLSLYDWEYWDKHRGEGYKTIGKMVSGEQPLDSLREADSEGAQEVIESISRATNRYHLAVNLPNNGQISNLPAGAIVETPGVANGAGISPLNVGALPESIAELMRREIFVAQRCVDAAVHGDRRAALECLLLDPVISDIDVAKQVLDDYLLSYQAYLPQFWD